MFIINKSKPIMGQCHGKKKQKKAERKSPEAGCTKQTVCICSPSAKAWCLKIIAGRSGIKIPRNLGAPGQHM